MTGPPNGGNRPAIRTKELDYLLTPASVNTGTDEHHPNHCQRRRLGNGSEVGRPGYNQVGVIPPGVLGRKRTCYRGIIVPRRPDCPIEGHTQKIGAIWQGRNGPYRGPRKTVDVDGEDSERHEANNWTVASNVEGCYRKADGGAKVACARRYTSSARYPEKSGCVHVRDEHVGHWRSPVQGTCDVSRRQGCRGEKDRKSDQNRKKCFHFFILQAKSRLVPRCGFWPKIRYPDIIHIV